MTYMLQHAYAMILIYVVDDNTSPSACLLKMHTPYLHYVYSIVQEVSLKDALTHEDVDELPLCTFKNRIWVWSTTVATVNFQMCGFSK